MKYIHTINKIGLWLLMVTFISFQALQAEGASEPCEDLSWLEQWIEDDCCVSHISETLNQDGEYIYYVAPDMTGVCPTDGPLIGYYLDCEGTILCEDYFWWTGEDSCSLFSSLPIESIIWESLCGDVMPDCDPTFSCDPGPEGEIYFFAYASDAISWLWEIDGEVVSTEPEFIFYGNIGDTHTICLTIVGQSGCEGSFCNEFTVMDMGDGCFDPMQFDPDADCIAVYDPVCGCDGVTYGNECEAIAWGGVTSWIPGECGTNNCFDPELLDPDVDCIMVYDPVCGCDGVTYGNECEAMAWGGVTSWIPGECGTINDSCFFAPDIEIFFQECYGTEDIPQSFGAMVVDFQAHSIGGDYISWSFSNGWETDLENDYVAGVEFVYLENGEPLFEPFEVCLTVGNSVLGCDETYCIPLYPEEFCWPDLPCIDETLIDPNMGCDDVYDPVCGCNGITYENACTAIYGHGVVDYIPGACEDFPCAYVWFDYEMIEENTLLIYDQSFGDAPITTWLWEVDGTILSEESEFTLPIDSMVFYDICLTITTESGCEESFCMPIDILLEAEIINDEFFGNSGEVIEGNVLINDVLSENGDWIIEYYTLPEFGELNLDVTTGDFYYTATEGFTGVDFFIYLVCDLNEGNCYEGTVLFIIDDPNSFTVNPDYVNGTIDGPITVCPLENDNITNDYSVIFEDFIGIIVEGDCIIIETSDLGVGTYEVSYTVCNEITDECFSSIIEISLGEEPFITSIDAGDDYESGDSNTEIVINPLENDIGIDATSGQLPINLTILDEPENGTVYVSTIEDCEVDCQIFVYEPNINFIGSDQFTYLICIEDNTICDTATVYIEIGTDCSEFCVWPGDANNDGIANNFDVLTLGLNYGEMGAERPNATTEWTAQPSPNWNINATENTEVDLKIADCDGNGIINDADMEVVYQNYGLSHGKTDDENAEEDGPSLRLEIQDDIIEPGTWMDIDVILEGLDGIALEDVYGVAFQVDYFNEIDGTEIIPSDSINVNFIDSWFNNNGTDNTLNFYKNLYELNESSKADIAFVRTNKESVEGNGPILKMSCFITANITGKTQNNIPIEFNLNTGKIMYKDGTLQDINVGTASAEIETPVGINTLLDSEIDIYPNPTKDFLQIDLGNLQTHTLTLYNNTGQVVQQIDTQKTGNITIATSTLPVGMYVLSIETTEGILHKKVQIIR